MNTKLINFAIACFTINNFVSIYIGAYFFSGNKSNQIGKKTRFFF